MQWMKGVSGGMVGGGECPDWRNAKPAAVVNMEHPWLVKFGFLLIGLGFFMQLLTACFPKENDPTTVNESVTVIVQ